MPSLVLSYFNYFDDSTVSAIYLNVNNIISTSAINYTIIYFYLLSGISNTVDKVNIYSQLRPPRAFERSASDATDLVLVSLNLEAASAQEFVKKKGTENGIEDLFLNYLPLDVQESQVLSQVIGQGLSLNVPGQGSGQGSGQKESIILSESYVYWKQTKLLWGRNWSNISHCFFILDSIAIVLYGGDTQAVIIPCGNPKCAMRVYSAFYENKHRMGCPSNMIPPDLLFHEDSLSESAKESLMERKFKAASLAGILDDYRFGNANNTKLRRVASTEKDVLKNMEARTLEGYGTLDQMDDSVWRLIWEWDCAHPALQASRCCATLIINRSHAPLQMARVQMEYGRNVLLLGSPSTGYESESRYVSTYLL